jgi:hypothetical protein
MKMGKGNMGDATMGPTGVAVVVFTGFLHDRIPGRVLSSTNMEN